MDWKIFNWRYLLIPFYAENVRENKPFHQFIGYTSYYVFGIRVVKIQKTKPW